MHYDWVKPATGKENSQKCRAGLNSPVPSCCRSPLFLGNDPTQDFTLTPNVTWGSRLGLFVMAHGGLSISLSTLFWSFVVVISFVSQLFSSLFCFELWSMHMAHSSNAPNVCLLSPSCLNFTLFFWCFGICILSTLQMHPMLYRNLGSTKRSLKFFVRESVRRDQQILIFCLWQSFFG